MKYKIPLFFVPAVLVCLLITQVVHAYVFSPENSAPGANSIYLSYNGIQSQGNIMAIDVRVNDLSAVNPAIGAAFDVDFDPSVLTYDSYLTGDFFQVGDLPENGNMKTLVAAPQRLPGTIIIGISLNNGDPGASGSGTLLTLKFRVAPAVSQVLQSSISLSWMNLIDLQGQSIEGLNWYNGHVAQYPLELITPSLSQGTRGIAINQTLTAAGGFPPYTWNTATASLPPGLTLDSNSGVISGIPSANGNYSFTIFLSDSSSQEVSKNFNMVVNTAPQITTSALPEITVNNLYNHSITAVGGTTPLTWDIQYGSLPPGITLNSSTGALSGTTTAPGTYSFTVRLSDANGASASSGLSIRVNQSVSISTVSLPETTAGAVYKSSLEASGGTSPYTWIIASGLPTGLSLIPETGEIVGISSTAGSWDFTVAVRDAFGISAEKVLSIIVNPSTAISTTSISNLYQDSTAQGMTFSATGGVSPYSWSLIEGNLPDGLTLDTGRGVVSGIPSKPGIFAFTIRVTDAVGISSSMSYQWVILATPPGNADFTTPGSVNRVDGYDLITLDLAFGTSPGTEGWNPLTDFNGDNVIDSADLLILQENFGKSNGL